MGHRARLQEIGEVSNPICKGGFPENLEFDCIHLCNKSWAQSVPIPGITGWTVASILSLESVPSFWFSWSDQERKGRKRMHSVMKRTDMLVSDQGGKYQANTNSNQWALEWELGNDTHPESGGRELGSLSEETGAQQSHSCQKTQNLQTATDRAGLKLRQGKEREVRSALHQPRKYTRRKS